MERNIIKTFNSLYGTRYQFTDKNIALAKEALDACNGSMLTVKDFLREHGNADTNIKETLQLLIEDRERKAQTEPKIEEVKEVNVASSLGLLEKVLAETIAQIKGDEIADKIMADVENKVRDFIKAEYGTIERKVVLVHDGEHLPVEGVTHEKFETVLKFVANDEPVFLTGGAGTGKNVLCQQVAKALGLDFYFTNAVTQEYKITGFTDAMGIFHETQFYKAFKNGGLFMLDEMDASIPEVLIILNAAIANRYFDFPAPVGYVEAHKDFRIISAGNTFGSGADYEYVGRSQLDMASLDRFAMVKIGYDRRIAENVCEGDTDLVDFIWDFREVAERNGFRVVVSYRAIGRIHKLKKVMDLKEVLETCLVKGMDTEDLKLIAKNLKRNKYSYAIRTIAGGEL